jgi:CheY-like chemotaxis protein
MSSLPRILVVDDDEPILVLMKNILREFKFEPITASSGQQALELTAEAVPDLILLDKNMPAMPGDELMAHIRQTPRLRDVPVLILSGEPLDDDELAVLGAQGAVQKPFDLTDLIQRIRTQLAARPVSREQAQK